MKTYKWMKGLLTITMVGLFTGVSLAQAPAPGPKANWKSMTPEQRAAKRVQMMKKNLNLTNAQVAKISDLLKQEQQTMKSDRENLKNATADQKAFARDQMLQDRIAAKEKVMHELTADQRTKAESLRKDRMRMHRWMHRGNGPRPMGPPQK